VERQFIAVAPSIKNMIPSLDLGSGPREIVGQYSTEPDFWFDEPCEDEVELLFEVGFSVSTDPNKSKAPILVRCSWLVLGLFLERLPFLLTAAVSVTFRFLFLDLSVDDLLKVTLRLLSTGASCPCQVFFSSSG